jgi:hypothetical protein
MYENKTLNGTSLNPTRYFKAEENRLLSLANDLNRAMFAILY